jgi:anthranilate phosphoribosyltransferase
LLGVYDDYLCEPVARVLSNLGVQRAFVVYGQDRMDEISLSAPTTICELKDGYYRTDKITPEDFGFTRCEKKDVLGASPQENAQITRDILAGKLDGPKRDIAVLNAAAALYISGITKTIRDGIDLARAQIQDGKATRTLEAFITESNR